MIHPAIDQNNAPQTPTTLTKRSSDAHMHNFIATVLEQTTTMPQGGVDSSATSER